MESDRKFWRTRNIMATIKKTANSGKKLAVEIGVGLAAVAATAAGAYFLYGKNGAKNRKAVKSWMLKAKAEALEQLEKAKDMSEKSYHEIIDKVHKKYAAVKNIDPKEVKELVGELKGHWVEIKKHLDKASKTPKKKAPAKKK